jgi:hypothetical protein
MTAGGLATVTDEQQSVTLTAHYAGQKQDYDITVMPRSLDHTLLLHYDFETDDVYSTDSGQRMLKDHSRHGRDAKLMNDRCVIDGTLNLTVNTVDDFAGNGYVLVPNHLLDSLRSYTVLFTATPSSLDHLPRFYDFGSAPSNSFCLRASSFAAGLKYNGQTTTLVKAGELSANEEFRIAVSFDARTHTTTVYVNGQLAAQDNSIKYEPCQLAANGSDTRNYIGRTQWWDTTSRNDNKDFCGTMDNFRLYSLCLTPDELTETLTGMRYETLKVKNAGWFDLSGRRLTQPVQKGIYIVDGKKTTVK